MICKRDFLEKSNFEKFFGLRFLRCVCIMENQNNLGGFI